VVICDNDSIHHARKVTAYLDRHPRLELLYGARYSPNDNPAERIWAALKNHVANTAVTWPGRLRQIHSFFRNRSPDQMLTTAAPWTSPWLPPGYEQNFWNAAKRPLMPACEPGPGLASQPRRAWVASSQPVTWPLRASSPAEVAGVRPRGTPRAPPGGTPAGAEMIVTRLLAARSGVAARSRRTIGPLARS
jgi:hypothetical protein